MEGYDIIGVGYEGATATRASANQSSWSTCVAIGRGGSTTNTAWCTRSSAMRFRSRRAGTTTGT